MSFFHAFLHARHHHHQHHHGRHRFGHHGHRGHHHEHGGHFDGEGTFFGHHAEREGSVIDHLAHKVASRLDLNTEQLARLTALIECLQLQREAVRGGDWLQQASSLLDSRTFDRQAAEALLAARVATVQTAVPNVLDAVAGFYDSLDADQQQVLRFFIRLGRRARGRRGDGSRRGDTGAA